jgi:hypothetical protein
MFVSGFDDLNKTLRYCSEFSIVTAALPQDYQLWIKIATSPTMPAFEIVAERAG